MQNRYVGDVGDFGKFGLLRFLSGLTDRENPEPRRLGVVWYLRPDERHNADGRHVGYLVPTDENIRDYGGCDRDLWARLGHLVGQDARCVHCVEQAEIFPDGTQFHRALLHIPDAPADVRKNVRQHWLRKARARVRCADLVFLDPDKGVARNDNYRYQDNGTGRVYLDDLRAFLGDGKSTVVYHHVPHVGQARQQARDFADQLQGDLELEDPIIALRFRRGSAPVFFIIPHPGEWQIFRDRVRRFLDTSWNIHFEEV